MRKIMCVLLLLGAVPAVAEDLVFPYGGVYFRKSNPPREDWERDYKTAAELGANVMRHWFMWAVIEVAPGKYDWDDYDRQMDLAAAIDRSIERRGDSQVRATASRDGDLGRLRLELCELHVR